MFEKTPIFFWTSNGIEANCFWIKISKKWNYTLNFFIKNDIFYNNITLLENSGVDNKHNFFLKHIYLKNKKTKELNTFYQYYLYNLKIKLTLIINLEQNIKLKSMDVLFKSLNWLERESSEMFKIKYTNKTDIRRLLLDYTKNENPLLKDFPTEGYNDVYYCFFNDQVIFIENNTVEL